ncbi:MAG: NnrU protein [Pseudomonadales bacterium]|nr:NnrU family protein [Pseudomonadales bacterium]NIX08027.1 NnrU protein [Pseudomonadales bacterium]
MLQTLLAGLIFVGAHLGISSTRLRQRLVDAVGERAYQGIFSVVALLTIILLIRTYGDAPRYEYLWLPDPRLYWVPKILMAVAFISMIGGFMVKNPTAIGMEGVLEDPDQREHAATGLLRITRHPFQWSVVLWSASHIVANGDTVSVVFFASFGVLSLLGTFAIDRKKAAALGDRWEPFAAVTSNLPFAAVLSGRNRLVLKELLGPVVVGLLVYALVFWWHQWVSGGVRLL